MVDGGFYRKQAKILFGEKTPKERAEELISYCRRHLKSDFDGEIKRNKNHEIISTKSEKNHGLGLPRIKSIIENSGGVLQITSENNIFSVHIMLPDKENKIE